MKKLLLAFVLLHFAAPFFAQNKPYFQQEAHYKIKVALDDVNHSLTGDIEINYVNHAPEQLDFVYLHLWANAFKDPESAYGQQELRTGSTRFYFAKDKDLGYYEGLDFTVDGQKVAWRFDSLNPDIAILPLPKPLQNKRRVSIKTPFKLHIPASFSRLGHVGTSYQMTQWYPKPAVYDNRGWHPMPYLDMGEFYSEFGSFEVEITLPANYVVGATGVLETESEQQFLEQKVAETKALVEKGFPKDDAIPTSSEEMKTLRYVADKVHDFAWFADKRFHVLKDVATLKSGRNVDAWAMFINAEAELWEKGAFYVRRAVEFYSENVGEYPYPHATAVHSALSAGGGMEYPMITVIGNSGSAAALDDVITHEVGHNWFYGILASNERDHAWMDEGINSFYEYRYMRQFYGSRSSEGLPKIVTKRSDTDLYEAGYQLQARRHFDQAPGITSNEFSPFNYGLSAYVKPGSAMQHLEGYLGREKFDAIMQAYFQKWGFAHPYPEDLRSHFEQESGKELGWFFDGYIGSNKHFDFALVSVSPSGVGGASGGGDFEIVVENEGELVAPFPISGMKNGQVVQTKWFEPNGNWDEQKVNFPAGDYDLFVLDAEHVTLDVDRKNNNSKPSGILKKLEPFQLKFIGGLENSKRTTLSVAPFLPAWNEYDGFMLGVPIHNFTAPQQRLEFMLVPMFGLESERLNGVGGIRYNIYPKGEKLKKITLGVSGKAFDFFTYDSLRTATGVASPSLQFRRLVPYVKVDLMRSKLSQFYQTIQLRSVLLQEESAVVKYDSSLAFFVFTGKNTTERAIHELSYEVGNRRALNPWSLRLGLEQSGYDDLFGRAQRYLKTSLELNTEHTYDVKRSVHLRLFAGRFFQNDKKTNSPTIFPEAFTLTGRGFNDYHYDDFYFGRSETEGILSQQITQREGGMKVALGEGATDADGRSNDFIFAINLKADLPQDLPGKLPLKPYFDLGYFHDATPIGRENSDQIWWQGGFALEFGGGFFQVNFPVVNSKSLRGTDEQAGLYDLTGRDKYWERITFSLDLARLNPWNLMDGVEF